MEPVLLGVDRDANDDDDFEDVIFHRLKKAQEKAIKSPSK